MAFMTFVASASYPLTSLTAQVVPGPLTVESGAFVDLTGPAFDHAGEYVVFTYDTLATGTEAVVLNPATYIPPTGYVVTGVSNDTSAKWIIVTLGDA